MQYHDREGNGWDAQPNWGHLYQDWADLKARHAIQVHVPEQHRSTVDATLALALFDLYFEDLPPTTGAELEAVTLDHLQPGSPQVKTLTGGSDAASVVDWLDGLVNVGWYLCSNT